MDHRAYVVCCLENRPFAAVFETIAQALEFIASPHVTEALLECGKFLTEDDESDEHCCVCGGVLAGMYEGPMCKACENGLEDLEG